MRLVWPPLARDIQLGACQFDLPVEVMKLFQIAGQSRGSDPDGATLRQADNPIGGQKKPTG